MGGSSSSHDGCACDDRYKWLNVVDGFDEVKYRPFLEQQRLRPVSNSATHLQDIYPPRDLIFLATNVTCIPRFFKSLALSNVCSNIGR